MGENYLGYPVTVGKQYKITATSGLTLNVAVNLLSQDGKDTIEAQGTGNSSDMYDSTWQANPYTFTASTGIVNGEDPVLMWMVLKRTDNADIASVSSITSITIEEL